MNNAIIILSVLLIGYLKNCSIDFLTGNDIGVSLCYTQLENEFFDEITSKLRHSLWLGYTAGSIVVAKSSKRDREALCAISVYEPPYA